MSLLERIAPRGLPRADQDHELGRLGSVGSDAAACALRGGATAEALALLERGRAIVLAQALDDTPAVAFRSDAPDVSMWTALADRGPIVVVNVSRHRSDALLVTPRGVAVEPLPALHPDTLRAVVERFLVAVETRTSAESRAGVGPDHDTAVAEQTLTEILGWLWDVVAAPALDRLDRDTPSWRSSGNARVWWCPTGLLSLLPLHAAGRRGASRGWSDSVPDRVVSSVTPTLWALARARQAPVPPSRPAGPDLLVVSAPEGSGQAALPAARTERELLTSLFPGWVTDLSGDVATTATVIDAIRRHRRLHVAGHAIADLLDPARSRLLVTRDGELTAAGIGHLRLPGAQLAYLSACGTARPGTILADEIVHLASTLHVAGFRHVIGTLWPVADRVALRMARIVYEDLARHDDPARLAPTVRAATRALRDRYPDHPSAWAATVHIGP